MDNLPVHSPLGASSYSRWRACPGSVRLSRDVPKTTSSYAEEGTRAHEIAAAILLGDLSAWDSCDDNNFEAIETYIDHVTAIRSNKPTWEAVEKKFNLTAYHPLLFGTADYTAYFEKSKALYVIDYKNGQGVAVEVEKNAQLMYYALGVMHELKFPIKEVWLTIVQPRCYHADGPVRICKIDVSDFFDFAASLIEDAKKTESPHAPLNPGNHCRFCPAQGVCPSIHQKSLTLAKEVFANQLPYSPGKLAECLNALPMIEGWAKSVREFAYREAEAGRVPPGFKLVEKRASRKWKDGIEKVDTVKMFGVPNSALYDQKLKSVAAFEKLLPKSSHPILADWVLKESSGKTLVPVSDNRKEAAPKVLEVFQKVETD